MVGSLLGIQTMFVGITEDIRSAGDYFHFDFGHVVGLDVVFFTVFIIAETDPRKQQGK